MIKPIPILIKSVTLINIIYKMTSSNFSDQTFELTNTQNTPLISTNYISPDYLIGDISETLTSDLNTTNNTVSKFDAAIILLHQYHSILEKIINEQSLESSTSSKSIKSIITPEIPTELASLLANFKPKTSIDVINKLQTNLVRSYSDILRYEKEKNTKINQEIKKEIRRLWNDSINQYHGILVPESTLLNLMFVNGKGFYKPEVKNSDFIDIGTLEKRENDNIICKVRNLPSQTNHFFTVKKSYGLISNNYEEMARRIMIYIQDIMDPEDLTRRRLHKNSIRWIPGLSEELVLTIRIPESDPESRRKTSSYSVLKCFEPRVLQNFFEGKFPGYAKINQLLKKKTTELATDYQLFYQLVKLIRNKICQLVNISSKIPDSDWEYYAVIRCARVYPKECDYISIKIKRADTSYPHICKDCSMELCPDGCGRIHHSGPCDLPIDDATTAFIASTTTKCPGCNVSVHKYAACNHITCTCGIHFCYICRYIYEKDINGQVNPSVTEHHIDLYQDGIPRCPL